MRKKHCRETTEGTHHEKQTDRHRQRGQTGDRSQMTDRNMPFSIEKRTVSLKQPTKTPSPLMTARKQNCSLDCQKDLDYSKKSLNQQRMSPKIHFSQILFERYQDRKTDQNAQRKTKSKKRNSKLVACWFSSRYQIQSPV